MMEQPNHPYGHLNDYKELVTKPKETSDGFVKLMREKARLAKIFVDAAFELKAAVAVAKSPAELVNYKHLRTQLLRAAGVSQKAEKNLKKKN